MLTKLALCLTLIACVGAAACAAALPPEISDCRVFKVWDFANSAQGWRPDHNVSEFTVKDGVLSFENTGPDPWITLDNPGGPDASNYTFIGIKMRSSAPGNNQFYFGTDKSPGAGEGRVAWHSIVASEDFRFYEISMSHLPAWNGRVTLLRLDPANGGSEIGARIEIDWIALYQVPARLAMGRPYVSADRRGTIVTLPITNAGGEPSDAAVEVVSGDVVRKLGVMKPRETRTITLRPGKPAGDIALQGRLKEKVLFEAVLAPPAEKESRVKQIRSEITSLDFPVLKAVNEAQLSWLISGKPVVAGVFRPLAAFAFKGSDGISRYVEVSADMVAVIGRDTAVLQASRSANGGMVNLKWTFRLPAGAREGSVTCEMTSTTPLDLLRFEGPRLLAGQGSFGASKVHALFPGLEYLEKDEPSGAAKHVGPKLAERRVPHPYKVTVPVMAVESSDGILGISWDPLAEWAPGKRLPSAGFESPNRSEGAKNHLMTLFAPSIPDHLDENADFARHPYTLAAGETIRLSTSFFARPGSTIIDVIPDHYASHGLPKAPPVAHGVDGTIDLCLKAYTESLYFSEQNGWKNHFGLHQTPAFNAGIASIILGDSIRRGSPDLAGKCKLDPKDQLTKYTGATLDWFSDGARQRADAQVARQSRDGGFAYTIDADTRAKVKEFAEIAGTRDTTLGDIGRTNSGLIARPLMGILEYALKTGSKKHTDAGLKGLARLNSFTVPRGAQTWEVHMHAPDVYAAGLAVDANVAGYRLTGDRKYLDHAKFWARSGLPFIYSWVPPVDPTPRAVMHFDEHFEGKNLLSAAPEEFFDSPRRQVNPGASIAVMGTSFYVVNWFGVPVQWCGLAWANSVRRYLKLQPDPLLQAVADATFASCTQQQFERGPAAGVYPDVWNLLDNTACTAFIAPDLILDYAYAVKGEKKPSAIDTAAFELAGHRSLLNSYAIIDDLRAAGSRIDASLRHYAGQDVYSCAVQVPEPSKVAVDGRPLPAVSELLAAGSGFLYDPANRALHIKYRSLARTAKLEVEW